MSIACVVLAAGLGKRMHSPLPKVLHPVCGIPMLRAVLMTADQLRPDRTIVVAGKHLDLIEKAVAGNGVSFVVQEEPKGTAHALSCARPLLKGFRGVVVVLNGDTPLLNPLTIKKFLRLHLKERHDISVLSFVARNPDSYGRIVRDPSGRITAIVEHKDAAVAERAITEVNSGVYAINHVFLPLLDEIRVNKTKGEYYLTDLIAVAARKRKRLAAHCIGTEDDFMGVNTQEELSKADSVMRSRIVRKWVERGVRFIDPGSAFIHAEVSLRPGTTIYPNVFIEGPTKIGAGTTLYPHTRIVASTIGANVTIMDCTVIEHSRVGDGAVVGPFARIRPGSSIGRDAKIGNFVELKKAVVGDGTKASHLSYIGDAAVGKNVNIGAGTITCNYDGERKHQTVIEDGVFVGSDTQFVAPVRIGKGAYIGAGSTITHDVPPLSLSISRTKQRNIGNWVLKRRSRVKGDTKEKGSKNGSGR